MNIANEFRHHYYLDEFVIIAPGRKKRPVNTDSKEEITNKSTCQFCNNKEQITYATPNTKNWLIKTVKNIYPCVDFDIPKAPGYQEVIIEFPDHKTKVSQITPDELFEVFKTYQNRMKFALELDSIKYVTVFKNMGPQAGASQEHLHSQIWAVTMVPPQIKTEIKAIDRYVDNNGSCPVCDFLLDEKEQDIRVLDDSNSMLLNPYASRFTYEAWVLPNKHYASLIDVDEETLKTMAYQTYSYLRFIEDKGYDYSLLMHDLINDKGHFYIKIQPRTYPMQIISGVELEAGLNVNVVAPEGIKSEFIKS